MPKTHTNVHAQQVRDIKPRTLALFGVNVGINNFASKGFSPQFISLMSPELHPKSPQKPELRK